MCISNDMRLFRLFHFSSSCWIFFLCVCVRARKENKIKRDDGGEREGCINVKPMKAISNSCSLDSTFDSKSIFFLPLSLSLLFSPSPSLLFYFYFLFLLLFLISFFQFYYSLYGFFFYFFSTRIQTPRKPIYIASV